MNTIAALRGGDKFVFHQVFIEYHKKLYFYILSRTKSNYLAEEVLQISFIKLWQNRISLDEDMSISRQLFRIAKTSLIDILRKEETNHRMQTEVAKARPAQYSNQTEEQLAESELITSLVNGIKQLPPMRRKIFTMSRFNGMSYKEIAAELSLSVKTVENHIARAIKQLHEILPILFLLLFVA